MMLERRRRHPLVRSKLAWLVAVTVFSTMRKDAWKGVYEGNLKNQMRWRSWRRKSRMPGCGVVQE